MNNNRGDRLLSLSFGIGSILIGFIVISILMVMVFLISPTLLDFLITFNITFAILLLLLTIYTPKPLELFIFPSLLLITTLYRLALNVASTRLILLKAGEGGEPHLDAAGEVIQAFGGFVVGGNYVVGFVVFLILIAIQYVVITSGAQRVAEVRARFTLDAMPGKQMAIDADLNSGLIDEEEARARREEITLEQDFYGSMDGASKFVKGDAIASVIIILVDIIGGLIIGVIQMDMSFSEALNTYTLLTVGDGLVTVIPALIISTATGIVITRTTSDLDLGQDVIRQILSQPRAVLVTAVAMAGLGMIGALPQIPLFITAGVLGFLSYYLWTTRKRAETEKREEELKRAEEKRKEVVETPEVDNVMVRIGYGLIPLVEESQGGELLERIPKLRSRLVNDLGFKIPLIRVRDDLLLESTKYVIELWGVKVAEGELMPEHLMAFNPSGEEGGTVEGIETTEPIFGHPALWIREENQQQARDAGYATIVTAEDVLITHLEDVIKNHADELLSLQCVQDILDSQREVNPALVEAAVSEEALSVVDVHKVLKNLLSEQVSIRNLPLILEALCDYGREVKNATLLTEHARQALKREIVQNNLTDEGQLAAVMLSPDLQQTISNFVTENEPLDPGVVREMLSKISQQVQIATERGVRPVVLLCPSQIRQQVRSWTAGPMPSLSVLSYEEMPSSVHLETVGVVDI